MTLHHPEVPENDSRLLKDVIAELRGPDEDSRIGFGDLTLGDLRTLPEDVAQQMISDLLEKDPNADLHVRPEVVAEGLKNLTDPDRRIGDTHGRAVPYGRLLAQASDSWVGRLYEEGRIDSRTLKIREKYRHEGRQQDGDPHEEKQQRLEELGSALEGGDVLPLDEVEEERTPPKIVLPEKPRLVVPPPTDHAQRIVLPSSITQEDSDSTLFQRRLQAEASLIAIPEKAGVPVSPAYLDRLRQLLRSLDFSDYEEDLKKREEYEQRKRRYFNARVGPKWRFQLESPEPQRWSRTRVELFKKCQRCFALRQYFGLKLPDPLTYKLNIALDVLLKKEYNLFREFGIAHPLMLANGLIGVPLSCPEMARWRHSFEGLERRVNVPYTDLEGNPAIMPLDIFGAVDDIWIVFNPETKVCEIRVVDYKATYTEHEITLDDWWKASFKRQVELYSWIAQAEPALQQLCAQFGFQFSNTSHFVYANGRTSRPLFNNTLPFRTEILTHQGDTSWIESTLAEMVQLLVDIRKTGKLPEADPCCKECKANDGLRDVHAELVLLKEGVDIWSLRQDIREQLMRAVKESIGLTYRENVRAVLKGFPHPLS